MLLAIFGSQAIGLAATGVILAVSGDPSPPTDAVAWALAAGAAGVIGLGAFYRALSRGTMGLIAPLTALIGAGVPAAVGMLAGESVSTPSLVGIVVALVAVVLISLPSAPSDAGERRALRVDLRDLPLVVVAGLGFAGFFLLLDGAVAAGGSIWWSLVFVRLAGLAMVLVAVAVAIGRASGSSVRARAAHALGTQRLRLVPYGMAGVIPLFALAGVGDFGGNAFFVLANEHDSLPVAVVLSSLYPIVTTALAVVFLHERLRPIQMVGVVLAIIGVTLISAGDALAPAAEAASAGAPAPAAEAVSAVRATSAVLLG